MTCPSCSADIPPDPVVWTLTICGTCLRSIVIEPSEAGTSCRLAVGADIHALEAFEVANLKALRKSARAARVA